MGLMDFLPGVGPTSTSSSSELEKVIKLYVIHQQKPYTCELQQQDTVSSLKMKVAQQSGVGAQHIKLTYKGTVLDNSKRLMDCHIHNKAKLEMTKV